MASRTQGADLDFLKVGKLIDVRINPLTTSARTTLGGTLGAGNTGLQVWDTDLKAIYVWDGSTWITGAATQTGLTPKGNKAFNDTEPASPVVGDLYVFNSAGSNTWEGTNVVQVGDQVYWDGTAWQFIQGNVIAASETVPGIAEIATQAEVNTGTDDARFVTPLKLATRPFGKVYFSSSITTVANTPLTVTHALNLQHRDACAVSFKVSNSEVMVDVDSIDVNSLSITTNTAMTGTIIVVGY